MAITNPFELGTNYLTQGADMAASAVSPESRNRAGARLRADLDVQRNRMIGATDDASASTGGLNAGRASLNRSRVNDSYFNSLSQGLGTMENQYAQNSIQAAGVQNQAGTGLANIANQQSGIKQNALNTYIQGGNALANPTGQGAQDAFGSLGLDVSGLGFFGPPGTTNPINTGSGTTVTNNIGGTTGATTPGSVNLPPNATPDDAVNSIFSTIDLSRPIVMAIERVQTPIGQALYKKLAEELGIPVQLVHATGMNAQLGNKWFDYGAGQGSGSIGA